MKSFDGSYGGALTCAAAALLADAHRKTKRADNRSEIRPADGGGDEMEEGNKATQSACVRSAEHLRLQRLCAFISLEAEDVRWQEEATTAGMMGKTNP